MLDYLKSPTFNHVTSISSLSVSPRFIQPYLWGGTENKLTSIIRNSFILKKKTVIVDTNIWY